VVVDMLVMMVKLLLVAGLMVAALLGMRHAAKKGMINRGGPTLQVVGRVGLTRNALVAVVVVDNRRFLVGAAETGINLLADLDAPIAGASQSGLAETRSPGTGIHAVPDLRGSDPAELDAADAMAAPLPVATTSFEAHGPGFDTHGPRIGPMDRLREMTVRSHLREPILARSSHHN
jgi:flagellar biogenesis protein FliO